MVIVLKKKLYTCDLKINLSLPYLQEASCYIFDNKTWNEFIKKNVIIYMTIRVGWGPDVFLRMQNILRRIALMLA